MFSLDKCDGILQKPGEGLLVELDERRLGRPTSGAAVAAQWFAQDLFSDAGLAQDDDEDADTPLPSKAKKPKLAKQTAQASSAPQAVATAVSVPTQIQGREARPEKAEAAAARAVSGDSSASSSAEDSDSSLQSESSSCDDEEERLASAAASREPDDRPDQSSGFEEVPVGRQHGEGSSDESSDDGFDDLDEDGRAEVLALAKKMLKGRDRQDIMDNAYHKYAFHETSLPRWFEEDEKRHMK